MVHTKTIYFWIKNKILMKKIINLFNKKDKRNFFIIIFIELLSIVIELFSIGLLPAFILLISDIEKLRSYSLKYLNYDLAISENNLIIIFSILIILTFLLKNIYLGFVNYYKNYIFKSFYVEKSTKLFNKYLNTSYSFHLKKNPAELHRNVTLEVENLRNFYSSVTNIFKEFIFILSIFVILLITNYKITFIVITTFLVTSALYFIFFKNRITGYSKQSQYHRMHMTKHINQSFGSIKYILISNSQNFFDKYFKKEVEALENYSLKYKTIAYLPKLIIEVSAVTLLLIVAISHSSNGTSFASQVPVLSLYVIIVIKLIPSFNIISTSFTEIKFSKVSTDLLLKEFSNENFSINLNNNNKSLENFEKLELKNVFFSYENKKKINLENINVSVFKNEIIGFIGKSGAGKSTLLDLIIGVLRPSSGTIKLNDKNLDENLYEWQKTIGYVPQDLYILDDTILNNIAFGVDTENVSLEKCKESLSRAQLLDFVESLDDKYNTILGNRGIRLSGGQRQRLGIARALYNNPKIIILDEATNALDIKTESEFLKILKNIKNYSTILIISHRPEITDHCDRVIKLENGKILN